MGKQTIAEFVGSAEVMEALREVGVDFAQGYWVHKPELFGPRLKKVATSGT
jgi:EAL domain-containing protein (putative c-di-GMP-specific phosphodiesterase class I)